MWTIKDHHGPEEYVKYLVRFIGAFFILFLINANLTIAIFCFFPILGVFSLYFNKMLNKALSKRAYSHRYCPTIRNAERIIVLTEDGIVEQGTHEALLARDGVYAHLYSKQFELQV